MDKLLQYIRSLNPFSERSWEILQTALTQRSFGKNEFLLSAGEVCHSLYYINEGYCKSYYDVDGELKNTGFFFENDIVTNVGSFGSGQRSEFAIVACEPLSTVVFDKDKLFQVAEQISEIDTLGRNCIRLFAAKMENLSKIHQLYTPQERYAYLEKHYPHFLQRIPITQLASFLGITRETLSRIRKRRLSS